MAAYCVFGYVLTQILYLGVWCRPFKQYWQVPVDNCMSQSSRKRLSLHARLTDAPSTMCIILSSFDHGVCFQHLLGSYHALYPAAHIDQSTTTAQEVAYTE